MNIPTDKFYPAMLVEISEYVWTKYNCVFERFWFICGPNLDGNVLIMPNRFVNIQNRNDAIDYAEYYWLTDEYGETMDEYIESK